VNKFIESLNRVLEEMICALIHISQHFIRQVVVDEGMEGGIVSSKRTSQKARRRGRPLYECEEQYPYRVFDVPYAGQRIVGALLEFVMLLCFMYADAALLAESYSVIFQEPIPPWLDHIILPLVVASSGSALILGVFLGDLLGLTHFGVWGMLRSRVRRMVMLVLVIFNLVVVIVLSGLVSLYRAEVIGVELGQFGKWPLWAQSIGIIPMLVTTALLIHGVFGSFVFLALFMRLAAVPIAVFHFFLGVLGQLLEMGVVKAEVFFLRLLWLVLLAFELLFGLIGFAIRMSYGVLGHMLAILFYVPYITVNWPLKKFTGKMIGDLVGEVLDTTRYAPGAYHEEMEQEK